MGVAQAGVVPTGVGVLDMGGAVCEWFEQAAPPDAAEQLLGGFFVEQVRHCEFVA